MKRDDISEIARDALADIHVLEKLAPQQKVNVAEAVNMLLRDFGNEYRLQYLGGIKELRDKKYIYTNPEPEYNEDYFKEFELVYVKHNGRNYIFKYLELVDKNTVAVREEENNVIKELDRLCLAISEKGIYIIIIAAITAITAIIDTALNIYNTFR